MRDMYVISIDQSTQGTKAFLFNEAAEMVLSTYIPHRQIIDHNGWVSHDAEEIYRNIIQAVKNLVQKSGADVSRVAAIGITNQRETSVMWDRNTGIALGYAVVWQCSRAYEICQRDIIEKNAEAVKKKTGMNLSAYFPAAKIAWLLENIEGAREKAQSGRLCHGTIDSWIIYRLTEGKSYKTDYSNASRTQLFNIKDMKWDEDICHMFGINPSNLPQVCDSNGMFGLTTFEGLFAKPVPIRAVLGDSHAALYGQGCLERGMTKATYGTGSSIMMNIGKELQFSTHGIVTSIAWGMNGNIEYVLEGNLNYTGAVITWMKDDVELVASPSDTQMLAEKANKNDQVYLVPAFSGIGAPYWNGRAKAAIVGMDRTTTKAEIVRAGLECIAYQVTDIVNAMEEDSDIRINELRVDGGPTRNAYLMQFQSDILNKVLRIPERQELSGIGAAYAAGISLGIWDNSMFSKVKTSEYTSCMDDTTRVRKYDGWKEAVRSILK